MVLHLIPYPTRRDTMSKRPYTKPLAAAIGTAVVASLGPSRPMVAGHEEGKCGEGKCGEDKKTEGE
jgi:hypothetical protein